MTSTALHTRVRHSDRAVFRRLASGEGAVVLHLETAAYHSLNETGAAIWEAIGAGETAVWQVVDRLRLVFPVAAESLNNDVISFLDGLARRGLVELRAEDRSGTPVDALPADPFLGEAGLEG